MQLLEIREVFEMIKIWKTYFKLKPHLEIEHVMYYFIGKTNEYYVGNEMLLFIITV